MLFHFESSHLFPCPQWWWLQPSKVPRWLTQTTGHSYCIPLFTKQCCNEHSYTYVIWGKILQEETPRLRAWMPSAEADLRLPILSLGGWTVTCNLSLQNTFFSSMPHSLRKWALKYRLFRKRKHLKFKLLGFVSQPCVTLGKLLNLSESQFLYFKSTLMCCCEGLNNFSSYCTAHKNLSVLFFKRHKPKINPNLCIISLSYSIFFPWRDFWY